MTKNNPLISVITSVYNGGDDLERTIKSVLRQTYKNIEYIIIDGGSKDNTLNIINKYNDEITYWTSEKDNGIYHAWNKGLDKCSGEWIAFLGSGDYYNDHAISTYVKFLKINSESNFISSRVTLINHKYEKIRVVGEEWIWKSFSKYMNVAHVGSLHHKSLFNKFGKFNEDFKVCGDYEFLLRAGKNLNASYVNKELCYMKIGGVSNSNFLVFSETTKAKRINKSRKNELILIIDQIQAILIWYLNKVIRR